MQSGCIFNSWALNEKHKEAAYNLARSLGCLKEDPKDIVEYLLKLPASDIVKLSKIEVCIVNSYQHFHLHNLKKNCNLMKHFLPNSILFIINHMNKILYHH
jgi:hypothetical protein